MPEAKYFLALCLASFTTAVQFGSADELKQISPFLNEQTIAVATLDLEHIDLAGLQKQYFDPLAKTNDARIGVSVFVGQVQELINQLRADGVRQIYIVTTGSRLQHLSLNRLDEAIVTELQFVVLPGAKAATLKAVYAKLDTKHKPPLKVGEIQGAGVVAFGNLFDELSSLKPQPRPELAVALAAAGDHPIRWAIIPPPLFARASQEILLDPLPGMETSLGSIVARGVKSVSIGVEPNLDRFAAHLVIQSADADAAKQLTEAMRTAAGLVGANLLESGQTEGLIGTAFLSTFLPVAEGDRLVLSVNKQRAQGLHQFASAALKLSLAGAGRNRSQNNLKQIGLALLNFEDRKKHLPDRAIRDKDGRPMLSWRVAILPEIEEGALYKEFHLDEPWDSEHNRKLIERMPECLRSPDSWQSHPGRTRYLAAVGERLAFPPNGPLQLAKLSDGTSNTILVVEADPDHSVIWTKPDDLEVDLENPLRGLATGRQTFNALFADGHVSVFSGTTKPTLLRAYFTRDGAEVVKE